jgi:LEA14-like dessication related protein
MGSFVRLAGVAALVVLATGCSALKEVARVREPEIRLVSMRLTGLGLDSVDLAFDIGVNNPNPVPVTLEAIVYDLFLEETRFLSGRQDTPRKLSALGESRIELPLTLDASDLTQTYAALEGRDSTSYELRARLTFQLPVLGYRSLGLKRSGRIPVVRPPRISVQQIRIGKLNLTTAELVLGLKVTNPNHFDFAIRKLDYNLTCDQQVWASGSAPEPAALSAGAEQLLSLPLSVDLSALGRGVYPQLLRGLPIDYRLTGGLDLSTGLSLLPTARLPLDLSGTVDLGR